jgi:hypothetical protein
MRLTFIFFFSFPAFGSLCVLIALGAGLWRPEPAAI